MTAYDFTGSNPQYEGIATVYFAFTSLSTVGFGDYHPISTYECIFCAIILLTGVNIFSLLMDTFLDIINALQELDKDLDDGDTLTQFFGTLKRFNKGKDIN